MSPREVIVSDIEERMLDRLSKSYDPARLGSQFDTYYDTWLTKFQGEERARYHKILADPHSYDKISRINAVKEALMNDLRLMDSQVYLDIQSAYEAIDSGTRGPANSGSRKSDYYTVLDSTVEQLINLMVLDLMETSERVAWILQDVDPKSVDIVLRGGQIASEPCDQSSYLEVGSKIKACKLTFRYNGVITSSKEIYPSNVRMRDHVVGILTRFASLHSENNCISGTYTGFDGSIVRFEDQPVPESIDFYVYNTSPRGDIPVLDLYGSLVKLA